MYDYDVIFIGSGHACNHGALFLARAGKKTAIAEQDKNGGTCTNYGCDAKIILDGPFEYQEGLMRYSDLGVETPGIDWTKLMAYKKQTIGAFSPLLGQIFTKFGVNLLNGHAELIDEHTVKVGNETYTAEYIVIGSGSRDAEMKAPGSEFTHDSKDFLDLDVMPERMVIVGAGIISMEFASMALALGKKVTIIHRSDRPLRAYPGKYVNNIIEKMKNQGAEFIFNENVASVEKNGDSYIVNTDGGKSIETDYVLHATGRVANVENLGLEKLGIEYSSKGIKTDEYMRTSVPNIFASGDVVDKNIPNLTPTAEFESNYIAAQILGINNNPINYPVIPNLVFTLPRIAQVGVSVETAEKNPEQYRVEVVPFGAVNSWVNNRETEAEITYIFDKEGYLAGAAVYGAEGAMMIDFLTFIIQKRISGLELSQMIFAFPTQTYSIVSGLIPLMLKK
ncbi:MAG: NAD(P)/FAD-dependent oxidoreductase [Lachnospiraceae bacterium]|nr:NAD(P)/FAD-dependent oxidoreductase [Lachnospiraceae bacterium]MDY2957144.1 NAD(P)/FAD-dependent oxidoreductase [Lachnospiraceae bacterium]